MVVDQATEHGPGFHAPEVGYGSRWYEHAGFGYRDSSDAWMDSRSVEIMAYEPIVRRRCPSEKNIHVDRRHQAEAVDRLSLDRLIGEPMWCGWCGRAEGRFLG
jgi:hypothetical protein